MMKGKVVNLDLKTSEASPKPEENRLWSSRQDALAENKCKFNKRIEEDDGDEEDM